MLCVIGTQLNYWMTDTVMMAVMILHQPGFIPVSHSKITMPWLVKLTASLWDLGRGSV